MSKLTFALQMEIDGEQYYLKQAEKNKNNALQHAFILLAQAEKKHAELVKRLMKGGTDGFADDLLPAAAPNPFTDIKDFVRDAAVLPDQLEVYTVAMGLEQKSIDLFQEMLSMAKEELELKILQFLVTQEKQHLAFFEELATLLKRPKEWVEAAEFGQREEY